MKKSLVLIAILYALIANGQGYNLNNKLSNPRKIQDCEVVTLNAIEQLSEFLKYNNLDSFNFVLNEWIRICGISECTQRLIILNSIANNENSLDSIKLYFRNEFPSVLRNRIKNSKKLDYGYIYSEYKSYYGYVPLNHSIDSLTIQKSLEFLESKNLSPDEKLICTLFSGNIVGFEKLLDQYPYDESFINTYLRKEYREERNDGLAYTIYSGIYSPIGSNRIFSYSPLFGITISTPLRYKIITEIGFKFRLNINDKSFKYYALGDTNTVNSDVSIFLGFLISYKFIENEHIILLPKFGIGLESVDTGLSKKRKNSDDKTFYDVKTVHLSFGLSVMKPIFKKSYIGLGFNYHFCPYQLDSDLYTKFDNSSISTEIFWRF